MRDGVRDEGWKVELIEQGVKDYLLPLSRWKPIEADGSRWKQMEPQLLGKKYGEIPNC